MIGRSFVLGLLAGSLGLAGLACAGASSDLVAVGGPAFSQEAINDDANQKAQVSVLERLQKQPAAAGADAVVAVTGTAELTGLDLSSGKTWSYKHPLDHRPQLTGTVVVGTGNGELFVLDARTGAEKWKSSKAKGKLVGAGSDGKYVAVTLKADSGHKLVVFGPDGSVKMEKATDQPLTAPGISAGLVLVPWKNLYVSAFEIETGAQLATFITDTETTHVVAIGGAVFAGQGRLVRFDKDLLKAKQGGSQLAAPPKELPNVSRRDLLVGPDHDERTTADAIDSTGLTGRPLTSGPAGFESGRLYGGYYPFVFGMDAKTAKLAWVHTGKDDFVAIQAGKDGVIGVDKGGNVKLLAASNGALLKTFPLGKPALSADILADTLAIGSGSAAPLPEQIKEATTHKDDRLSTAQVWFLDTAAAVPDEATTEVLLQVADSERAAPPIKEAARKAIALRTNGASAMITLLGRHANFLKGTRTPPVGPMAKALAGMKEKKAVQPLLDQLLDPALPQIDLQDTAESVAVLAEKEHLPQLQRFVNMYRGSATGNIRLVDSIAAIAAAILRIDDKGRDFVVAVAKDSFTDTDVKATLEKMLAASAPKKEDPKDDGKDDKKKDDKKKKKVTDDDPTPPGYKKKKAEEGKKKDDKKEEKKEEKKD